MLADAAMPPSVATTQKPTIKRLWARTQRVTTVICLVLLASG